MFGSSRAPVTFVDVLWSLFHLLKGMSVRMEHATASSASSNAVEIRLQEPDMHVSQFLNAKCLVQVAHRDVCGRFVVAVSFVRARTCGAQFVWLQ